MFWVYTFMQIAINTPILRNNIPLLPKNKAGISSNTAFSSECKNIPANLSPAYFHPSFSGINPKHAKEFSQLLDNMIAHPQKIQDNHYLKASTLLEKIVESAQKDKNIIINTGGSGNVYKIDDKYVIKIRNYFMGFEDSLDYNLKINENSNPMGLKSWFGDIVAKSEGITIMRNADPEGIQIPVGAPFKGTSLTIMDYYKNNKCISKLAELPQKSFDEFAQDLKILNENLNTNAKTVYKFDYENPNNFLIVGDKIRAVDDLDHYVNSINSLDDMLIAFIHKINAHNIASFDEDLVLDRQNVFKKCVLACEKNEIPIHEKSAICAKKRIDNILMYSKMNTNYNDLVLKLEELRNKFPNMDERLKALSNFLDSST